MLPYIYDYIKKLVRKVWQFFVKYEVIENCKTAPAYKQLDLSDFKSNILNYHLLSKLELNIGHAADITIAEMK